MDEKNTEFPLDEIYPATQKDKHDVSRTVFSELNPAQAYMLHGSSPMSKMKENGKKEGRSLLSGKETQELGRGSTESDALCGQAGTLG